VSDDHLPRDADLDQLSSSLNEGLKTCRSMVANYRALLSNDNDHADNDEDEAALEARLGGE
jgi:hypothetical protein